MDPTQQQIVQEQIQEPFATPDQSVAASQAVSQMQSVSQNVSHAAVAGNELLQGMRNQLRDEMELLKMECREAENKVRGNFLDLS